MKRSIIFIGVPCFPIAVERVVSRRLRDRPVVLVQSLNARSRCLAVSLEAHQWGIRRGMSLNDARRHCRNVDIINPDLTLYRRAMTAIKGIVDNYTPRAEPNRYGQYFLDITGSERLFGKPLTVAETIQDRMIKELKLPAGAGVAVNKMVSRVSALDVMPEGILMVDQGGEEPFMAPHLSTVLPSVDDDIRERMTELNIRFVCEVRELNTDFMIGAFGPSAFSLSRQAKGIDPTPVLPPESPPQVQVVEELPSDSVDRREIHIVLKRMIIEGMFRLQKNGFSSREFMLTIYYADGQTSTNSRKVRKAVDIATAWFSIGDELLQRTFTRRVRVRRIEIVFAKLTKVARQLDLWDNIDHDLNADKAKSQMIKKTTSDSHFKSNRILNALKEVQDRYGTAAMNLGVVC